MGVVYEAEDQRLGPSRISPRNKPGELSLRGALVRVVLVKI